MSLASADLPSDPDALRAFALACQSELAEATAELQAAKLAIRLRTLEIEKPKFQLAKLRRMQFGRSSERVTRQIEQLELRLEELHFLDARFSQGFGVRSMMVGARCYRVRPNSDRLERFVLSGPLRLAERHRGFCPP